MPGRAGECELREIFAPFIKIRITTPGGTRTWLIAFGDYTGGRLWIESPIGVAPPPNPKSAWQKKLRGEFHDVKNKWLAFDPQLYIRSRPGKPNQRKGQNEKFMNFAHFCEFWCFSSGKQARFTLNFCSGMPLRKVHELAFLWFGLPGWLLSITV